MNAIFNDRTKECELMKLIRLRIENDAMDIAYHPVSGQEATVHYLIAYNPDQSIGENLENIKVRLACLLYTSPSPRDTR